MISSRAAVKYFNVKRRDLHDLPIRRVGEQILYKTKDVKAKSYEQNGTQAKFRQHIISIRKEREAVLSAALAEKGLKIRRDGFLCTTYLKHGETPEWPLDAIVRRMCEIRFLYDYTPYEQLYAQMLEWARCEKPEKEVNKKEIQKMAEESILSTLVGKTWPARWPWLHTYKEALEKNTDV